MCKVGSVTNEQYHPSSIAEHDPAVVRVPIADVLRSVIAGIEEVYASSSTRVTGIADVDEFLVPLGVGTVVSISAERPVDAVTLALQTALSAAVDRHDVIAVTSAGSSRSIAHRLLVAGADVPGDRVVRGALSESDWGQIGRGLGRIDRLPISIVEQAASTSQTVTVLEGLRFEGRYGAPVIVVVGRSDESGLIDRLLSSALRDRCALVIAQPENARGASVAAGLPPCDVHACAVHLFSNDGVDIAEVAHPYRPVGRVPLWRRPGGGRFYAQSDRRAESGTLPGDGDCDGSAPIAEKGES